MIIVERTIKIQKANESVYKMKEWYEGRTLPSCIRISQCQVIFSLENYVQTAFATLEHSEVLSRHYRAAYSRLYALKQELEKINTEK